MEPFDPPPFGHPVVALLDRVEDALDQAVGSPVFALDTAATAEVLKQLTVLESKVAAVKLAALAHAEAVDVAGTTGASSTATWWAHATRTTPREAFTQTRLAGSLAEVRHPVVRDALAAGGSGSVNVPVVELVETAQPVAGSSLRTSRCRGCGHLDKLDDRGQGPCGSSVTGCWT